MKGLYINIPWKPTFSTTKQLKVLSQGALKYLELNHYDFYQRYDWNIVGDNRAPLSSKDPSNNLHITLVSDIHGRPDQLSKFVDYFTNGIRKMAISPSLLKEESVNNDRLQALNKILKKSPSNVPQEKAVKLKFKPELHLFGSSTSSAVFVAGIIDDDPDTSNFFGGINLIAKDICDLLEISVPKEVFSTTYHVSLVKSSEPVLVGTSDPRSELSSITESLVHNFDSSVLQMVPIEVNTIEVDEIDTKKVTYSIRLIE
ncbi:hypothetical protein PSN45_004145 [Yamadazyma tenuis]|uniref:uncharacterized protein n=1 Tax=Candida tenuis TaxID=2315449 RepID=UPI002798027D|nr:hypothetical protein PSN45_004145 [Yamadazyma tenuis]